VFFWICGASRLRTRIGGARRGKQKGVIPMQTSFLGALALIPASLAIAFMLWALLMFLRASRKR
jgi:hypothetical protein